MRAAIPVLLDPRGFNISPQAADQSIAHDIVDALARETGLPLKLHLMPMPQAVAQVQAGAADVMGVRSLPEADPRFGVTSPLGEGVIRAYAWAPRIGPLERVLTRGQGTGVLLEGLRVAVVTNLPADLWLQQNHPAVARVPARDVAEAVQLLRAGKADVLLGFELSTRLAVQELSAQDQSVRESLIEGPLLASIPYAFAVHVRNPQLLAQLDRGLRNLRARGEIDAIRRKWEPPHLTHLHDYRIRQWMVSGAALSVFFLLLALTGMFAFWRRAARLARERGEMLDRLQWMQALEMQTFEASATPMGVLSGVDGRLVRMNRAAISALGYPAEHFLGQTAPERDLWVEPHLRRELVQQARQHGASETRLVQVRHASGQLLWLNVTFRRFAAGQQEYLLSTFPDVTGIETRRREYEALLTRAPIGIAVLEGETVVLANPECERLMGWPEGSAVGRWGLDFWRDRAERQWARDTYSARLRANEAISFMHELGGPSGRRFTARGVVVRVSQTDEQKLRTMWIVLDASDEMRVATEREAARRAAEAASAAKSRFLANVSHEIRTPLHALVNLHEMLGLTRLTDTQRELLTKVSHAGHSLMALVNDVLDFSKIEAGALVLEHAPFSVDALLQGLEAVLQSQPRAPGVQLLVDRSGTEGLQLVGDAVRLRQVLINLGGNALKFTQRGEVLLHIACAPAAQGGSRVVLHARVHDTGIGMDAVTQAALFTPFLQADASVTRTYGGTGLGLAISQSIVRAMGGEITVQSTPGAGSVFSFSIELATAAVADPLRTPAPLPAGAARRGAALAGLRVLVVDDNDLNRFVLKRLLSEDGATVGEAGDGRAALQWLATIPRPPDLVLMDLQMPVMDGLTALRAMQADTRWRAVPVVVLTGDVTLDQQQSALKLGARAFLAKPILRERLLAEVALLGLQPRPVDAAAAVPAAAPAATDAAGVTGPAALVPQLDQLDELLLTVAVNELEWARVQLSQAVGDAVRMAQVAHRIKGTAKELRCEPLVAAALALEQACKRDPQAQQGAWPVDALLESIAEVHALLAPRHESAASR